MASTHSTSTGWLTVDAVEDIHRAVLGGKSVISFIGGLSNATLAGLVEYTCLRQSFDWLPVLPTAISSSTPALALARATPPTNESHIPVEAEFVTVTNEAQVTSLPMKMFYVRFAQGAKVAGFSETTVDALQAALNEMIENAIQHSNAVVPILGGYCVRPSVAQFVVADTGRGVLASLRENPRYASLKTDVDAIQLALHDGVSRFEGRGGFGFRPIFKALAEDWGLLRFRSREGCWMMDGTHPDADHGTRRFPPSLPGFQISITCRLRGAPTDMPLT